MQNSIRLFELFCQSCRIPRTVTPPPIHPVIPFKIGLTEFTPRLPRSSCQHFLNTGSVCSRRGSEDPCCCRFALFSFKIVDTGGERVPLFPFLADRYGLNGLIEQGNLTGESISEQAGNSECDVYPWPIQNSDWRNLNSGNTPTGRIPERFNAHQKKRQCQIFPTSPERRRAPQIHHDAQEWFALFLKMSQKDLLRLRSCQFHSGCRWHGPRVHGEQITASRKNIYSSPGRRARRTRSNKASFQSSKQRSHFRVRTGFNQGGNLARWRLSDRRHHRREPVCMRGNFPENM